MESVLSWLKGLPPQTIVIAIVVVIIVGGLLKVAKKLIKIIFIVVVVVGFIVYLGVVTPEQIKVSTDYVTSKIDVSSLESIGILGDTVRVTAGVVEIKVNDNWYSFDDITRIRLNGDGLYIIEVEGESMTVTDKNIAKLISILDEED